MSKMGQAVFEGQEFAQENYNVSRDEFIKLADTAFKSSATIQHQAAVEEWETIQNTPLEERDKDWRKKNPVNYQVAFTYKALNRLIQASSADQTKRAMKDCVDQGHVPMITVHDELCFSIKDQEQIKNIKDIMENCFPEMKIPSRIDVGVGENWGKAK